MIQTKQTPPKQISLYELHLEWGAKVVPFAGYPMPLQYPMGLIKEHLWTREKCGIFDVSHSETSTACG